MRVSLFREPLRLTECECMGCEWTYKALERGKTFGTGANHVKYVTRHIAKTNHRVRVSKITFYSRGLP